MCYSLVFYFISVNIMNKKLTKRIGVYIKKVFKEKNKKERWNNTDRKSVEQWTTKTKTELENCKM